jgi:hypothetical protein
MNKYFTVISIITVKMILLEKFGLKISSHFGNDDETLLESNFLGHPAVVVD